MKTWRMMSCVAVLLVGCSESKPQRWEMLEAAMLPQWVAVAIEGAGKPQMGPGEFVLPEGAPMTAVRFGGWESIGLPVVDYAIEYEAMRVAGQDFFGAVTFPIRSLKTCATLVNGGWGGGLVGISNIDEQSANENATRGEHRFVNGQWYRFRLEVRSEEIRGWLDGRLIINASLKARTISLRAGDIERCAPFGLATYGTTGKVRGLVVERLP
jgi:hypothetical protein